MIREGDKWCYFCGVRLTGKAFDLFDKITARIQYACHKCWEASGKYHVQKPKNNYVIMKAAEV